MRLFRVRCPVEEDERAWIAEGLARLSRLFPERPIRSIQVVEPTPEFFPGVLAGSHDDARRFFGLVCEYLGADADDFELNFLPDGEPDLTVCGQGSREWKGPAGEYWHQGRPVITLAESMCSDPLGLVATIAHELGHALLFAKDPALGDDEDHEPFTDLLTVFTGFGIFTANTALRERQWQDYQFTGWSVQRLGYLNPATFGYALAMFAWARGEARPKWDRHLCKEVHRPFRRGLRFLARKGAAEAKRAILGLRTQSGGA